MKDLLNYKHIWHTLRGGKPLSYFNRAYMFFILPLIVIIYNIIPKKLRPIILLLASFIVYYLFSSKLIGYLLLSILSIYISGMIMNKIDDKKEVEIENHKGNKKELKIKYKRYKKIVLLLSVIFNLSFLFFFKYLPFFKTNGNLLLDLFNIDYKFKIIKHLAPIGISFYTLEAISYLVDVYNNKIKGDKNIIRLALYLSFFPQIMEGPIARYSDTAQDLYSGKKVTYENFCFGYQRIFYGILKKTVIANRVNILVKLVFENYTQYSAIAIIMAIMGYTLMLYAEFSGTMDIVIGSGEMFGVRIPENFKRPFFAKNVSEFWTRWHITLGTWFKDYIFYPISLSSPVKKITKFFRKIFGNRTGAVLSGGIALFAVWFLNGLWHGAGYTFLVFGLYHFLMIFLGGLFEPLVIKTCNFIHINRKNIVYRVFQSMKMTMLIFIGELFFRAPDLKTAFGMLSKIFTKFSLTPLKTGELLELGLGKHDFLVLIASVMGLIIIGLIQEKGINIRKSVSNKNIIIRWIIYYALILAIVIFGAYGPGYAPVDPIYADF